MFVPLRFFEEGLRKYFLPGFGKQPVEVFPVPDVDECEQHPHLFPQVFPAQLFLQGPLMDTAAKFHSLFDQEHQHAKGCHHIGKVLVSMAVIMLEIVAKNILQGGKLLIFHFPAGTTRTHHGHHPFLAEGEIGYPGPGPAAVIGTDLGVMEEVDLEINVCLVQGDIMDPPELVGCNPFAGPFGPGVGPDIRMALDPVEKEPVVSRLHAQDETDVVVPEVFDVGSIGGQGILDDNRPEMGMVFLEFGDEPLGGVALTIVLVGPILPGDHLRCQRNDNFGIRMDKGPAHHLVLVGSGSVPVVLDTAGGTMDLFGTVVAGPIKGQQVMAVQGGEMFQDLRALQFGKDGSEGGSQMTGVNPVETFPQAGIGRGFRNTEEGPQVEGYRWIINLATGLEVKLQERGQLEKEHGHSRQQAVPEGKATMVDRVGNGFENPAGHGQELRHGKVPAKADFGHDAARQLHCCCVSFCTGFAIRAEMFQWGLRKIILDNLVIPLFMGVKNLSGNH